MGNSPSEAFDPKQNGFNNAFTDLGNVINNEVIKPAENKINNELIKPTGNELSKAQDLPKMHSINCPIVILLGIAWGFIIRSGEIPSALKGICSCG